MMQIVCPHCLENVDVPEPSGDAIACCPSCMGLLGPAGEEELALMEYDASHAEHNPATSADIKEYVHYLERRARKEKKEEPPDRRRFPVELTAALVLFGSSFILLLAAFFGELGIPMLHKLFGAVILFMIGVVCLRFSV